VIQTIRGIHHVTAIAIDPQANIDFYTQVVGLRLVKDTVNFDDPGTYHFYYGDKSGQPGTILTFFPFVSVGHGRSGSGMVDTVTFAVSAKSLDGWIVRLAERGVDVDGPFTRFSRPTIGFRDPDGLKLEIAAVDGLEPTDAAQSDRDVAASIGGFGAVTLCVEAPDRTIELLTETFGYRQVAEDSGRACARQTPAKEPSGPSSTCCAIPKRSRVGSVEEPCITSRFAPRRTRSSTSGGKRLLRSAST